MKKIEIFIIFNYRLCTGICSAFFMQSFIFPQKTKREKGRIAGAPRKKNWSNKNYYLFNFADVLHNVCSWCMGGNCKRYLPAVNIIDICRKRDCICSGVLLLESKGGKHAENQSSAPGLMRHAV